ncbi:hypothetical protein HBI56_011360 [Parastagonospora nodorum]|nr:hypothetical protein HBI10_093980 [Parastagonospora nodorum]KAH4033538.1 hypothetical protein HBI13_011770 [Parastagonospora nodorum]KAH4042348.1 hypothetical protein HBI09_011760 [Parastagonospora nodorum]KAH4128044.1 hypothetical protein HBH47_042150 [Parastagonospora nodorum]KAH4213149.1 hypothetical protein HBI95_023370 [Parastagonospora nodorum]
MSSEDEDGRTRSRSWRANEPRRERRIRNDSRCSNAYRTIDSVPAPSRFWKPILGGVLLAGVRSTFAPAPSACDWPKRSHGACLHLGFHPSNQQSSTASKPPPHSCAPSLRANTARPACARLPRDTNAIASNTRTTSTVSRFTIASSSATRPPPRS